MDSVPTTNAAPGGPLTTKSKILETGASMTQNFAPIKNICAHLNAFHAFASEPSRAPVESNHYCSHLNEDVRQCVLYDSPEPNARLIGIEYMISPRLYNTLPQEERRYWHSHVFEVKSGMLIMPTPTGVPESVWEVAETKEMEDVIHIYGKIFQTWDVTKGDVLPLGEPQLMTSFTEGGQMEGGFEKVVGERDGRMGSDWRRKKEVREEIEEPEIHGDADWAWKADKSK
ncbi:DUF1264-domain-containing protein [Tothia fuscella]|uniref:DUF1264-domain-containing protein n=1 Tax=Tothia fuscella TaxID=1048955 RepID=A0A9P4NZT4_9PEZI|nr:DUF1264-domain-containing protein [Tothia fuscella]